MFEILAASWFLDPGPSGDPMNRCGGSGGGAIPPDSGWLEPGGEWQATAEKI